MASHNIFNLLLFLLFKVCHSTEDRHGQNAPRAADNVDDREPADTIQVFLRLLHSWVEGGVGAVWALSLTHFDRVSAKPLPPGNSKGSLKTSPMCFAPGRCFPSWRASPTRRPDVLGVWELLESLLRSCPSSARTQMLSALTVVCDPSAFAKFFSLSTQVFQKRVYKCQITPAQLFHLNSGISVYFPPFLS